MPVYAVTGASGHLGRLAIEQLQNRGVPPSDIVAVVRTPAKVTGLSERGVQVREGDYSSPPTLPPALAGAERLLLVSSSQAGQRVAHHVNVIRAAVTAGVRRIVYTSMLNADESTSPLAGEHRASEQALRDAGVPFTLLRNGYYTETYTDHLTEYVEQGEIIGAAGDGQMSAAPREDYAGAAATALLQDDSGGNLTYELGGPAFDLSDLAGAITEVTGTKVIYRDLSAADYTRALEQEGMDESTAQFVAALDTSVARGDLQTSSQDLARLLGHPATSIAHAVRAVWDRRPR
jgi:NAD(P)H dehydrogenase (quinone)